MRGCVESDLVISPRKVVRSQIILCNEWMKAVFKQNIQQIFITLIEEKSTCITTNKTSNVGAIKNEHSA